MYVTFISIVAMVFTLK